METERTPSSVTCSTRRRSQQRGWKAVGERQEVAQRKVERGQSLRSTEKSPEINMLKEWSEVRCVPQLLRHRCP